MQRHFKSTDGIVYLNVHAKARRLWGIIDLYLLWTKGSTTYRIPLTGEHELAYALSKDDKTVCIEIGFEEELRPIFPNNLEKIKTAHTITHDGYVYIRMNDIL
jgi:hypothetical protein